MDLDIPLAPPPEEDLNDRKTRLRPPWGTLLIVLTLGGVFLAQLMLAFLNCPGQSATMMCAAEGLVESHPTVGLALLPFLHGSTSHLLSNMVILLLMGMAFERRNTAVSLLGFFVVAAYLSIFFEMAIADVDGTSRIVIGMSGATRALSGFVIVQYILADQQLLTFESFGNWALRETPLGGFAVVVPVVALYATVLSVGQYLGVLQVAPETAFLAHFAGSGFGVAIGLFSIVLG